MVEKRKHISPTYISSDLHSPEYKTRLTIPWKSVQKHEPRILGGKMWGENMTNYGGIGKLSFLGKRRVRDLFVARNQKHFSSGLSRYETNTQPYMLTAFKYSGCRQNDQVLPPCFKIGKTPQELYVYDGSPILPYFSHNSKHEVFPRHDPDRRDKDTKENVLSERCRDALKDYYKHLYEMPVLNSQYPNHMENQSENTMTFQESQPPTPNVDTECSVKNQKTDAEGIAELSNSEYSRIVPLLANLCMLSARQQSNQSIQCSPLKRLLISYIDELCDHFSDAAYEEFYKVTQALQLFASSTSAKEIGINMNISELDTISSILNRQEGTCVDKVRELRDLLGISAASQIIPKTQNQEFVHNYDHSGQTMDAAGGDIPERSMDQQNKNATKPGSTATQCNFIANTMPAECIFKHDDSKKTDSTISNSLSKSTGNDIEGISPCWPPSPSYALDLRTLQLKSTRYRPERPKHNASTNRRCNLPAIKKLEKQHTLSSPESCSAPNSPRIDNVNNCSSLGPGLTEYKEYISSVVPVSFDERGFFLDELRDIPEYLPLPQPKDGKEKYIGCDKLGRTTFLPPVSLSECLPASGNRIQDRLGLKFKTEAHKRFHAQYPDEIPDLRDNFNFRKRHFFHGFHTSVMR